MKDLFERQAAIDAVLSACKDTAATECEGGVYADRIRERTGKRGKKWENK